MRAFLCAIALCVLSARLALAQEAPLQPGESARIPGVPFEELARRAEEASRTGQAAEAVRFCRAGLELNPRWTDGWWRLALLQFDAEHYSDARDALRRLVSLESDTGPAWALLGLSEFKLQHYEGALADLQKAVSLGVPQGEAIGREAIHYLGLLLVRGGQFAASAATLARLVQLEPDDPELVAACGLMALRKARLPSEIPESEKDLVLAAGRATHAALSYRGDEARRLFGELVTRYPGARGVHYAYGLFLSRDASADGLAMLQKEVQLYPDHVEAHLEIAFTILDRGDPKDALLSAQAAARLAPEAPSAHLVLGRALVATGSLDEGLRELEQASRMDPDVRDVHVALAQAYARAGRTADVERERAKLFELEARRGAR